MTSLKTLGERSVEELGGLGAKTVESLNNLGAYTILDLLLHLPVRYQDRVNRVPIAHLEPGCEAVIAGVIVKAQYIGRRQRMFLCKLEDDTGQLDLLFFYFRRYQQERFLKGKPLTCFGRIRQGAYGVEISQPEYRLEENYSWTDNKQELTPVYRLTKGLSQNQLRRIIEKALNLLDKRDIDPTDVLFEQSKLPNLTAALHLLHKPPLDAYVPLLEGGHLRARKRLAWEEIIAQFLVAFKLKDARSSNKAKPIKANLQKIKTFLGGLPFEPTSAQKREIDVLLKEIAKPHPMMRLLQGDVGSGKTLVAIAALMATVESGAQAALMVPTAILAQQHFRTLEQWSLPVKLLTSQLKAKQRNNLMDQLIAGEPRIVVGTHALFQQNVRFGNLGLVVIDEQHKFGVHQRLALQEKGEQPHQLIMTATPIPRTLAMTLYSELKIGVLDEMPKGRQPVITAAVPKQRNQEVMARISLACQNGQQAYWICPFIEASEEAEEVAAAHEVEKELNLRLPDLRVGLLHGRLSASKKDALMAAFRDGEVDILVATTVVEVGVDVPNATIMVIDSAERLGLAQLHQLRGRVGRSERPSYCLLLYKSPLNEYSAKRLAVMRETTDGFRIAEQDLALRGAGELLGSQQTGRIGMRIANPIAESEHLDQLREIALATKGQEVAELITKRWLPESARLGQQA